MDNLTFEITYLGRILPLGCQAIFSIDPAARCIILKIPFVYRMVEGTHGHGWFAQTQRKKINSHD